MNIIGCGQAAGSLARLWLSAGAVEIGAVMNRSEVSSRAAVERLGSGTAVASLNDMPWSDIWLIGSTDEQIAPLAGQLAGYFAEHDHPASECLVFHLAGRYGVDQLDGLAASRALLAAMHPVRSLTHAQLSLEQFAGTVCVAEGSNAALQALKPLIDAIEGRWMPVNDIDRGLYHAALSVVSNVTKAVTWKAENWLVSSGLPGPTATAVVQELLQSTVEDLFRSGARKSITGPVVRGDTSTVGAHMDAIAEKHPEDMDVYRILVQTILELAQDRGDLDQETLVNFTRLLKGKQPT